MLKNLKKTMLGPITKPIDRRIARALRSQLREPLEESSADANDFHELRMLLNEQQNQINALSAELKQLRFSTYCPDPTSTPISADSEFLRYSNCQAADFYHPRFIALCKLIGHRPRFHRKQWEWVFIMHQLIEAGMMREGARGLVFGVGREPLPAVFASLGPEITATDAPLGLATTTSWTTTDQHSAGVEGLLFPDLVPDDLVRRRVTHRYCDMTAIGAEFTDYDFNWSSCCFEHLGTLEAGMDFVVNAVEKTLKIGGIAVHTTEFNASSNDVTVESGETVMYRRRDMEALVQRLRDRGHHVEDFKIGPTAHTLDFHVDTPPYTGNVHLKLLLANYVATSVGIVVRRGR